MVERFGVWEPEDLAGGKVYHPAVVEHGVLSLEVPWELIHHGEMGTNEKAKLRDVLYEVSKLLRFNVMYNHIDSAPDGETLSDGRQLVFSIGSSTKRSQRTEVTLLTVFGKNQPMKLLNLGEVGASEMVNRDRLRRIEADEIIGNAEKFEGPVWALLAGLEDEEVEEVDWDGDDE